MLVGLMMEACGFGGVLVFGGTMDLVQGVWLVDWTVHDPFSITQGIDKWVWQVCHAHFEVVYYEEKVVGIKAVVYLH